MYGSIAVQSHVKIAGAMNEDMIATPASRESFFQLRVSDWKMQVTARA